MSSIIKRRSNEAFASKWTPEPFSGCHLWIMATNNHGYGVVSLYGKLVLAHRLSWKLRNGEIPTGICVLHRCDTPSCVNPDHLFLGTKQDNTTDMCSKGRAKGGTVKVLTVEIVKAMRSIYSSGKFTYTEVGSRFGIHKTTARSAIVGESWKNV